MTGQEVIKRHESMGENVRGNWERLWQECADWAMPTNDNINRVRTAGLEKPPQRMIDSCIEANFNFASGFFSRMFPPNTIWAKYRHPSPEMMAIPAVADYFERVSRTAHQLLIGSNFAQEEFQALLCMGAFGTNCLSIEEDEKDIIRFRNFVVGNVRMDQNYLGRIDTVSREFELTSRQAIQQFGMDAFKENGLDRIIAEAEKQSDKKYKFIHMVCPREEYDSEKKDKKNKPFASYYVIKEGNKPIISEGGFDYNPYTTGRFTVGNDEVYGRGPMSMVLGTARRSNVIYRSAIVAAEQSTVKLLMVPDDESVKMPRRRAIDQLKWKANNPNGRPELLQSENPGIQMEMFELHDAQIKRMFFNHLFRPLEDYRNMTAWEARERSTTDMMQLSPFTSRYIDEHVTQIMNTLYYIMQKRNLLPDLPAELADAPQYEVDYVGPMALVTKNFEVMGAVNTLRIFGELSQLDPRISEVFDNVHPDKLFSEVWYADSSSMNARRDPKEVEAIRADRAQQAQQQQQMQNAPAIADAAQKLSGSVAPDSILAQMGK